MAGAGFFWEKSTAGWLLVAGSFWEKSTAGWWLISRANRRKLKMGPERWWDTTMGGEVWQGSWAAAHRHPSCGVPSTPLRREREMELDSSASRSNREGGDVQGGNSIPASSEDATGPRRPAGAAGPHRVGSGGYIPAMRGRGLRGGARVDAGEAAAPELRWGRCGRLLRRQQQRRWHRHQPSFRLRRERSRKWERPSKERGGRDKVVFILPLLFSIFSYFNLYKLDFLTF
jgi:hypothetical protein